MIYDVILILIFLIFIIVCAVRGAAKSLAGILVSIVSYLGATYLGRIFAVLIYDKMLRPAVDKAIIDTLGRIGTDAATKFTDSLPGWLEALLKTSGVDIPSLLSGKLSGTADIACSAVNNAVRPAAVNILTVILTIVVFILLWLLLRLIVIKPVLKLFRLPGINVLDRILGAVIGFVDAFLVVSLLGYLLRLLLPLFESNAGWLNESTIYNSFIFYHFYSGNIFTMLISWIGL